VTGCSDGAARVWTTTDDRVAPPDVIQVTSRLRCCNCNCALEVPRTSSAIKSFLSGDVIREEGSQCNAQSGEWERVNASGVHC
jgi:hypothetical protein